MKKEDKKDVKVEADEPFDPTKIDKVRNSRLGMLCDLYGAPNILNQYFSFMLVYLNLVYILLLKFVE